MCNPQKLWRRRDLCSFVLFPSYGRQGFSPRIRAHSPPLCTTPFFTSYAGAPTDQVPPPTAPQVRTLHSPRPPPGNGNPLRPTQFFALGGNLSSSTRLQFGFAFCSRDSPFRRASQTSGFLGVCVGRPTIPSPSAFPPQKTFSSSTRLRQRSQRGRCLHVSVGGREGRAQTGCSPAQQLKK